MMKNLDVNHRQMLEEAGIDVEDPRYGEIVNSPANSSVKMLHIIIETAAHIFPEVEFKSYGDGLLALADRYKKSSPRTV